MKNMKRILSVTIRRMIDESPDTSYLGEYASSPDDGFSVDRATDEFQADLDAGRDWLERIQARLDDMRDTVGGDDSTYTAEWDEAIHAAMNTIEETLDDDPFDARWNRHNEHSYFNPSSNYKGESPEDIRKYVRQDYERMESLNAGNWCYIGIRADAAISIRDTSDDNLYYTTQQITSGGLWGIESDSDKSYLAETEQEQLSELRQQLKALGFSTRSISAAFKNIKRKDA